MNTTGTAAHPALATTINPQALRSSWARSAK